MNRIYHSRFNSWTYVRGLGSVFIYHVYHFQLFLTILFYIHWRWLYDPWFRSDRKLTSFWIILQVVYISFSQDYRNQIDQTWKRDIVSGYTHSPEVGYRKQANDKYKV